MSDSMKRLARANPVKTPPSVPPFARPYDEAGKHPPVLLVRRTRGHARRNGALALAALAGAAAISVVLASGSSRSPVDVLAAVYAATAPQAGIVESTTIIRSNPGSAHASSERLREWLQASTGRLRAVMSVSNSRGSANLDVVYSPRTWEIWRTGISNESLPFNRVAPNTILRLTRGVQAQRPLGVRGEQWTQIFHTLYLKRQFRVAGKVRWHGRLLWKLEATPARARTRAREDGTSFYALVDPNSFFPVYTRLIDLARPGHPTLSEVEVLSRRTLPASATNEGLFDLTSQYRAARVVTMAIPTPSEARADQARQRRLRAR